MVAASLWVIGPHVICVRCFAQQGTAWRMCILLAGIGVRSLVNTSWVRWFYLVSYSMRIACHCVDCVLSWKEKRAHKVCILIILMCLCLPYKMERLWMEWRLRMDARAQSVSLTSVCLLLSTQPLPRVRPCRVFESGFCV